MNHGRKSPLRLLAPGLAIVVLIAVGCSTAASTDEDAEPTAGGPILQEEEPDDDEVDVPDEAESPQEDDPAGEDAAAETPAAPAPAPAPKPPAAQPITPKPAAKPPAKPPAEPASQPVAPSDGKAAVADGEHAGRLVKLTAEDLTVELVRVLSGDEAVAAAKADGVPLDEDGTLPNDVYVQKVGKTVTIPVAGDGGFRIYDCTSGCEIIGVTWSALVSGKAVPYAGPNAVVNLTVDHGMVVSFEEQYLP